MAWALGLVGYPLGHSLSPRLHRAALQALSQRGDYRLYEVPPEDEATVRHLLDALRQGRLHGLNVTIPHKRRAAALADALTPTAQAIGAVNTLFAREGRLWGDNTDAPGFWTDLRAQLPAASARPGMALVLGAGGAARAVVYALLRHGWRVWVVARRPAQAQALCRDLSAATGQPHCTALAWGAPDQWLRETPALIVNTTPVGMAPHAQASPWPATLPWPPGAALYDLVYNPRPTLLVRQARAAGLPAADGLGMLIEQAALAFERWTGLRPPRQALWQAATAPTT